MDGHNAIRQVLENIRRRTKDMRTPGTRAREPPGHRLRPRYFFFSAPEGGENTRLGGELRREGELISRTGMCVDRGGNDNYGHGKGVFACPNSGTTGVPHERRYVRLDKHKLNTLDDQRPRRC
jgi:hypothetical protein